MNIISTAGISDLPPDSVSWARQGFTSRSIGPAGLALVRPQTFQDDRGAFTVLWRGRETWYQDNEVLSHRAGTIRGLHYQGEMWQQAKLVRVLKGLIFDVCVHLASREVITIHLGPFGDMLYVPKDFAHGYMTLEPDTIVAYKISDVWSPENEAGLRWNDPALAIQWPRLEPILNDRDASWPLLARPA